MSDILVEIRIPAAEKKIDVSISEEITINELNQLLLKGLSDSPMEEYIATDANLCNAETGQILNGNQTVAELGLINGSVLLLI